MTTPTLTDVVVSLSPNHPAFYYEGNTITGWDVSEVKTGISQPTQAEIDAEVTRLQAEYDAQAYARSRALEYPSIGDQLDMIYHNGDGGATFQAAIKAVKDKYPK